jgi:hypothetical protein
MDSLDRKPLRMASQCCVWNLTDYNRWNKIKSSFCVSAIYFKAGYVLDFKLGFKVNSNTLDSSKVVKYRVIHRKQGMPEIRQSTNRTVNYVLPTFSADTPYFSSIVTSDATV